ncbi:MAG: cell division protein FtsA [Candidatus Nealsonbacteria bacterium CG23_combo_of_CG06-09_8_20_14_all_40_13]|uniref:Cell division protein FtsA n=1 Tax=Candidatus Nealsonbacteria bacterium CG23_combo_of_CG06-09_8_20_14_all_40_13 TaxID=1974724 RepID=A0A2G9YQI9_9BACT|nr:MAG: cell division protein FtsA [Candidatus Nealsonbacteria bacterium CG23_combo_of_CG06-09_8_20_14_all_40_13]PIR71321.1 MAG: cell division protein FtsA [Candidatus Nealsonbacteria bacterium CG10_big_fil_rev_8_21_14_0_10_40_24]PIU43024.1 MAG: cell division protein FtsA [Candidatus Nealsonbacteria bacterium CG07_land_8_20_14_0_80_40_10]
MPKDNLIVGLDVGTTKVSICVGNFQEGIANIIAACHKPNSGMRKGTVADIEETVSAISAALDDAERTTGTSLSRAVVGISGSHIVSTDSKGVIAVSRADGEITQSDVERVLEAARAIALPTNQEIIHVIPKNYIIDGQGGIKEPVGMSGIRLEVEAHVIGGTTSAIKNLSKCVFQAGLEIADIVFSPLATSKALLSKKQKEIGVLLVDFGAGTTSLAAYEEGEVIGAAVLPVGCMHITNDIAIGLRTSLETAEKIKIKEATAAVNKVGEKEVVNLNDYDPADDQKIPKKYLAQIVEARLDEIFNMIREKLRLWNKEGMLPAGIVFTGGGSKLNGLVDAAKEKLRLPAQVGSPFLEISGMVDKIDNPIYATSVGLLLWAMQQKTTSFTNTAGLKNIGNILDRTKNFFKQFLP